jgi:hypothetical protein
MLFLNSDFWLLTSQILARLATACLFYTERALFDSPVNRYYNARASRPTGNLCS